MSGSSSNYIPGIALTPGLEVSVSNVGACNSYTAPNGTVFTTSGVYRDTLSTLGSCDSLITENITISSVSNLVTKNGKILTSSAGTGTTYQWFDCDSNKIILGETSWRYIATYNGNFSVIVNKSGCIDTSLCHNVIVNYPGIEENSFGKTTLSPNPNNGLFNLIIEARSSKDLEWSIMGVDGRSVLQGKFNIHQGINQKVIGNEGLSPGVYFLKWNDETNVKMHKFLVID